MPNLCRSSDYSGNTEYVELQEPFSFFKSISGTQSLGGNTAEKTHPASLLPNTIAHLLWYEWISSSISSLCFFLLLACILLCRSQTAQESHFDLHIFQRMQLGGFWLRGRGVPLFITCQTVTSGRRGINTTICLPVNFLTEVSHDSSSLAPLCVHCSLCFPVLTAL